MVLHINVDPLSHFDEYGATEQIQHGNLLCGKDHEVWSGAVGDSS